MLILKDVQAVEYHQLIVDVVHYEDEDIWVATSEDIRGMVVESQGIAVFLIDVVDVAVQLLDLNEQISAEKLAATRLRLRVEHEPGDKPLDRNLKQPGSHLTELQLAAA